VNAPEVIPAVRDGDRRPMVFPLFAERIRKASESPDAHARAEIGPLQNRSANTLRIGTAHDWDYLHGLHFGGTVACFAVARSAIDLDELGEVATVAQCGGNGRTIGLESIRSDLETTMRGSVPYAFNKLVCGGLVAFPHRNIEHQLGNPFMPIEFSAAAYRFGHSMVRPIYRLNTQLIGGDGPNQATQDEIRRGMQGRFFIFAGVQNRGLNGFDSFPSQWAIDWSLFFNTGGSIDKGGAERLQPAYKVDTSLVNPLGFLPEFCNPAGLLKPPLTIEQLQSTPIDEKMDPANLGMRNLLRGLAMGLPSGQAVAELMGIEPIADEHLLVGKAVLDEFEKNQKLTEISEEFRGKAPLWYYVLAEAQYDWFKRASLSGSNDEPVHLGQVGGRIVAETLLGLLYADGSSYVRRKPNWTPSYDIRTMGDLIQFALG
jgi:hypothetical protein